MEVSESVDKHEKALRDAFSGPGGGVLGAAQRRGNEVGRAGSMRADGLDDEKKKPDEEPKKITGRVRHMADFDAMCLLYNIQHIRTVMYALVAVTAMVLTDLLLIDALQIADASAFAFFRGAGKFGGTGKESTAGRVYTRPPQEIIPKLSRSRLWSWLSSCWSKHSKVCFPISMLGTNQNHVPALPRVSEGIRLRVHARRCRVVQCSPLGLSCWTTPRPRRSTVIRQEKIRPPSRQQIRRLRYPRR